MGRLPRLDLKLRANLDPHVVIVGAGASRAAAPLGDRFGRSLPLMADLVDTVGLGPLLDSEGIKWVDCDFETLFQDLTKSGAHTALIRSIESAITAYFQSLLIPEKPTVYDYLLLGLREKDVIATFNWDPFLVQAYKRNVHVKRLPQIVFLHGNVAIAICVSCRAKGFYGNTCTRCSRPLAPTTLLYPVGNKNYTSDPFIAGEWEILRNALKEAYLLTIFGYRAPSSDAEAIELLRSGWEQNGAHELAEIEIVDIRPEENVLPSWEPFITSHHYGVAESLFQTLMCRYPRRSCEAFAFASLQQEPWRTNAIPSTFESLGALQIWVSSLLMEEEVQEKEGKPFSGLPNNIVV